MSDPKIQPYEDKMKKSVDYLAEEYQAMRAGRANPHVLDKIRVDYYGTPTPINQLANVSVPEARIISIQPWDKKMIKEISRAIAASDVGINPVSDATSVRLVFPEMTEENRKNLAKDVKKKGEEAKVAVRNLRRDANDEFKKLKKSGEVSEDTIANLEDEMQKLTDTYMKKIDVMVEKKSKEIMTV
ncbi:MAG TPA: ribosome recycling factor [Lachnospiraceae bacterium]|jgi:ribosome recycling factor|nr:ribosome recycling factor [Lachnospiraceae bacterium]